jgi:hypothetical protein
MPGNLENIKSQFCRNPLWKSRHNIRLSSTVLWDRRKPLSMVASTRRLLIILSILLLSSASVQSDNTRDTVSSSAVDEQLQSPTQIDTSGSPVCLRQIDQCPTSPKPVCSDPHCQGPIYISPMQFQCEATTVSQINGVDVTLTGCHCCPLQLFVWCPNHDCRAPTGTRQCASEELEGCACETSDDRAERFRRESSLIDIHDLAEGELEEDLIEINDDGIWGINSMTQGW